MNLTEKELQVVENCIKDFNEKLFSKINKFYGSTCIPESAQEFTIVYTESIISIIIALKNK